MDLMHLHPVKDYNKQSLSDDLNGAIRIYNAVGNLLLLQNINSESAVNKRSHRFDYDSNSSISFSHCVTDASLGIRQSLRGEKLMEPTLGPSGKQLRLNC